MYNEDKLEPHRAKGNTNDAKVNELKTNKPFKIDNATLKTEIIEKDFPPEVTRKIRDLPTRSTTQIKSFRYLWYIESTQANPPAQAPAPAPLLQPPFRHGTSGGHHWRPAQACSLKNQPTSLTSCGCWRSYGECKLFIQTCNLLCQGHGKYSCHVCTLMGLTIGVIPHSRGLFLHSKYKCWGNLPKSHVEWNIMQMKLSQGCLGVVVQ